MGVNRLALCFLLALATSCAPRTPQAPLQTVLYIYGFRSSSFLEFSRDLELMREIPFSVPPGCGLLNVFPPPTGSFLLVELSCPNGQTVLFLDTDTGHVSQPIRESDSHFLAWSPDGKSVYLKVDSLGAPRIVLIFASGRQESLPIEEFTYDLAPSPVGEELTFTFSGGLGKGSELWRLTRDGANAKKIYSDPFNYLSFARFSPDGRQIAFIKIPDTTSQFTVGELWVMDSDGANPRKLADADAGHGYAANWSPDGGQLAFVMRENPGDERADQSSEALISNVYLVEVENNRVTRITHLTSGHAETPIWSPDGNTLAFNAVVDDRMTVQIADLTAGKVHPLDMEPACCPVWLRK